jgi:hypothetical protein
VANHGPFVTVQKPNGKDKSASPNFEKAERGVFPDVVPPMPLAGSVSTVPTVPPGGVNGERQIWTG